MLSTKNRHSIRSARQAWAGLNTLVNDLRITSAEFDDIAEQLKYDYEDSLYKRPNKIQGVIEHLTYHKEVVLKIAGLFEKDI